MTYCVSTGVFLLCGDYCSASLGSVEGTFTADNCLTLRGTAFGLAADFGDGIPVVRHVGGFGGLLSVE